MPRIGRLRHHRSAFSVYRHRTSPSFIEEQVLDGLAQRARFRLGSPDEVETTDAIEQACRALEPVDRVSLHLDERDRSVDEPSVGKANRVGAVLPAFVQKPSAVTNRR